MVVEARHMRNFSGVMGIVVGGGIDFCLVFAFNSFYDKALTGETQHSVEFLLHLALFYDNMLRGRHHILWNSYYIP